MRTIGSGRRKKACPPAHILSVRAEKIRAARKRASLFGRI